MGRKGIGIAVVTALLVAGTAAPAADAKKREFSDISAECTIDHPPQGATAAGNPGLDLLQMSISMGKENRQKLQEEAEERGKRVIDLGLETTTALFFILTDRADAGAADVVDGSETARFNKKGKAEVEMTFDSFGTYEVKGKLKAKGFRKATYGFRFTVDDLVDGPCDVVS